MTSTQTLSTDWRLRAGRAAASEDAALVKRAQSGDQMAFREIVERYKTRVMSFVYRILRNPNDAEDVAQEVFASAFFALRDFELHHTLISWLYRIAVNESFEWLRKKRARPLVYESDLNDDALQAIRNRQHTPASALDSVLARREMLVRLLSEIPPGDRSMLLLREVEGYSLDEIASVTGLTGNAIKVRLSRARKKLLKAARRASAEGGAG
jgi:RNA polymerase sigma-70 factor (ECF subfamily)